VGKNAKKKWIPGRKKKQKVRIRGEKVHEPSKKGVSKNVKKKKNNWGG